MNTLAYRFFPPRISRRFWVLCGSIVIVVAAWAGQAAAEAKTNLYVYPAGNIGNAYTIGSDCSGATCINAQSYTSSSIYFLGVDTRHWHLVSFPNPEVEKHAYAYNSVTHSGDVAPFAYVTPDPTTSRNSFQVAANFATYDYYTSYPDGSASTYSWWNCGKSAC
jgi:hypothetical protein